MQVQKINQNDTSFKRLMVKKELKPKLLQSWTIKDISDLQKAGEELGRSDNLYGRYYDVILNDDLSFSVKKNCEWDSADIFAKFKKQQQAGKKKSCPNIPEILKTAWETTGIAEKDLECKYNEFMLLPKKRQPIEFAKLLNFAAYKKPEKFFDKMLMNKLEIVNDIFEKYGVDKIRTNI